MIAAFDNWFRELTRREQVLVSCAAALVLVLLLGGIAIGLYRAHENARTEYNLTVVSAARVAAQIDRLERGSRLQVADIPQSLHLVVAASAGEQGFTLIRNDPRGNNRTSVAVESARPAALFGWFNTLERQGILVDSVSIQPTSGGNVSADAELRKAGT